MLEMFKSKMIVRKKSRRSDLMMNSKKILSEFLVSEQARKEFEDWEEENEEVLKIIEPDCIKIPCSCVSEASNAPLLNALPKGTSLPNCFLHLIETQSQLIDVRPASAEEQISPYRNELVLDILGLKSKGKDCKDILFELTDGAKSNEKGDDFTINSSSLSEVERIVPLETPELIEKTSKSNISEDKKKVWNLVSYIKCLLKKHTKLKTNSQ